MQSLKGLTTNTITFPAPAATTTLAYTFRVRATLATGLTDWSTSIVTVIRHPLWIRVNGILTPLLTDKDRAQRGDDPPQYGAGTYGTGTYGK